MIIGISGLAGSGKDTAADLLVREHKFVKVSFADPMKRICRDVYKFSFDQLWGPSAMRNAPDERYPREHVRSTYEAADGSIWGGPDCVCCGSVWAPQCYLTPRFALQQLGSEWGRVCYSDTWVDYLIDVAQKLENKENRFAYNPAKGLVVRGEFVVTEDMLQRNVVVPDVRFENEIKALRKAGAKLIRITRPDAGLSGAAGQHRSETEQTAISDDAFDAVIANDGTLFELGQTLDNLVARWV